MSKLNEYLKLIPNGVKNLDKLVAGIINQGRMELGIIPDDDFDTIVGRRAICATCPFMSKNAVKLGVYKTERTDEHCMHCGCPIATRTASLEANCGIESYNEKNPENQLSLKWKAVI